MPSGPGSQRQEEFWKAKSSHDDPFFDEMWPSESRGDGLIRKNNLRTGAAQGKSNLIRKAPCRLCGFPNDLVRIDHSGGSIDGEGAAGAITTATASAPTSAPASITGQTYTHTENHGTQAYRNASGCALCFSKNSTLIRTDPTQYTDPWDRLNLTGF